jgi:hypothetical protein
MSFGGGLNFFRILYRVTAEDAPPARRERDPLHLFA